jgi:hypothetical protein
MRNAKNEDRGAQLNEVAAIPANVVGAACHGLLDAASSLVLSVDFLADRACGTEAERESAAADVRECVMRLSAITWELQAAARAAAEEDDQVREASGSRDQPKVVKLARSGSSSVP